MKVRYSKSAQAALFRSNKRVLIRDKIEYLASHLDLQSPNVTKLKGRDEYRLRVQDWRVIFLVEADVLVIVEIGPRGAVYKE